MNLSTSHKINLLTDKLRQLESKLLHSRFKLATRDYRNLIDERRQLLAYIVEEQQTTQTSVHMANENSDIDKFLDTWSIATLKKNCDTADFQNTDFCDSFLDQSIPKIWNFSKDVLILVSPCSPHLIKAASKRGQKHIIAYHEVDDVIFDGLSEDLCQSLYICRGAGDIKRTFTLIQTPVLRTVILPASLNANLTPSTRNFLSEAVSSGQKNKFENTRAATKFGQQWAKNILTNLPKLAQSYNLHDISTKNTDAAVIVASGPSLNKNIDFLAEIQDKVLVVTALRSFPILYSAGIKPDVVVQLDAETDEIAANLAFQDYSKIENFVYEPFISPGFLDIPAKNYIWSLSSQFYDIHNRLGTMPTPFNVPSVSIYGLHLCHYIGIKNLCFVGQDLAASGDKQYAAGATELLPANSKLSMFNVEVPGFYGSKVMTRSSFAYQIQICSDIADLWSKSHPDVRLFNATEGGAYIDGFEHLTLNEFSKKLNLKENLFNKSIVLESKSEVSGVSVDEFMNEFESGMCQITKIADKISKLDKIQNKPRGLDKKICKEIEKFKSINSRYSLLQTAMQDEIAKVAGTSEKGKATSSYSEFFASVKNHAVTLREASKKARLLS